jgi:hypothetical protein
MCPSRRGWSDPLGVSLKVAEAGAERVGPQSLPSLNEVSVKPESGTRGCLKHSDRRRA